LELDSQHFRRDHQPSRLAAGSAAAEIVKSNLTLSPSHRLRIYRSRHRIENFFCRNKDKRRVATGYDKLARNFLGTSDLVGSLYWISLWDQILN